MSRRPTDPIYRASLGERLEEAPPPAAKPARLRAHPSSHPGHAGRPARLLFPNLLDTLRSLLSFLVAALFILTFVMQPYRIPSESMERTLLVGDFLLVNKIVFGPAGHWSWLLPYKRVGRGDIVVFHFPLDPPEDVVKRVVAVPGDRIELRNGGVYLNGQKQDEPFAVFEGIDHDEFRDQFPSGLYTDPGVDTAWWAEMQRQIHNGQLVLPPNSYFVLGDNRNHSRDSRYWGFVPPASIEGRPFLIYFSLREPSKTDTAPLPGDRLGHGKDPLDRVVDFARWDRMFRIVR